MTHQIKNLILLVLIAVGLGGNIALAAEAYSHPDLGIQYELPSGWRSSGVPAKSIFYYYNDAAATTLSIIVQSFPEPPTANGLQLRSAGGKYDGWNLMLQRTISDSELARANAEDGVLAVYRNRQLDDNGQVASVLAAEYYFVKQREGAVIGFEGPLENWKKIQPDIKQIVDSFWLGQGPRTQKSQVTRPPINWHMTGIDPTNRYGIRTHINPKQEFTLQWQKEYPDTPILGANLVTPLAAEDIVYWAFQNEIMALNIRTGEERWSFSLGGNVQSGMALADGILTYVVRDTASYLVGIHVQTGQQIFKKSLPTGQYSAITIVNNTILLTIDEMLHAFEVDTGDELWRQWGPFNPSSRPVSDGEFVFISTTDGYLYQLDLDNGRKKRKKELLGKVQHTPMILAGRVIFVTQDEAITGSTVQAYSLDKLEKVWHANLLSTSQVGPASGGLQEIYIIGKNEMKEPILYVLNVTDGSYINRKVLKDVQISQPVVRSLVAGNQLLVPVRLPSQAVSSVFIDRSTFEINPLLTESLDGQRAISVTLSQLVYKDFYVLMQRENGKIRLQCQTF